MIRAIDFQYRTFNYTGLGLHQLHGLGRVGHGGFLSITQLAPSGASCVDQHLPSCLGNDLSEPRYVNAEFLEIMKLGVQRMRGQPGARFFHRSAIGNAKEGQLIGVFHAIRM